MSEFEFFFSFFGLLLGLSVAEVATKLADAVGLRHRMKIGALTALLAVFLLFDIASFWMWTWGNREVIHVTWPHVFGGLVVAVIYFLAAALVFPRHAEEWQSLDDHFWANKRLVIGGIIAANAVIMGATFSWHPPALTDYDFFAFQISYWVPLIALAFVRSPRWNIGLLAFLIAYYIVVGLRLITPPAGGWSASMGL